MLKPEFKGMGVALITPFKSDASVDFDALGIVIENIIKGGAEYLVVLGTTAETPTLTRDERIEILRFVNRRVSGRIPLIAGCGGNCTRTVIEELQTFDFSGYSAILSVVPYYNKPSQEGIYSHFAALASTSPLPLILYNIPGRTGTNMSVDTILRLARDFSNIIGIKEASGEIGQIKELLDNKPEGFMVIAGDDAIASRMIRMGANGVISVVGNALPGPFSQMIQLSLNGSHERAAFINENFAEIYKLMFRDGNPAGVKCMLHIMGQIENILRLPLVPASLITEEKIRGELKKIM